MTRLAILLAVGFTAGIILAKVAIAVRLRERYVTARPEWWRDLDEPWGDL